jgi:hypothetical protein
MSADPPPSAQQPTAKPSAKPDPVVALIEKLNVRIENPVLPKGMTAGEYVAKLSKEYGVEIALDEDTFKESFLEEPSGKKLSFQIAKGTRLRSVLLKIAENISPGGDGGTSGAIFVHPDRVEITRRSRLHESVNRQDLLLESRTWWSPWPWLSVAATDRPLAEILREVADVYEVNIVVTASAVKTAETRITTRLLNTPLDTGIETLARQAGLGVAVVDNVYLITSPAEGKSIRQEQVWDDVKKADDVERNEYRWWLAKRAGLGNVGKWIPGVPFPLPEIPPPTLDDRTVINLNKVPLHQALSNLTRSGFNIVIDPAVGKKAEEEVTLMLNGTSCEAAVKMLAEVAGLRAVRLDNTMFVTTPEKADKLVPREPEKLPKKDKKK